MFGDTRYTEMNTWGSVVTPLRYRECPVFEVIERKFAIACKGRQAGNITSDLKARGEYRWIERIKDEVNAYNEEVRRHNAVIDDEDTACNVFRRMKGVRNPRQMARSYINSEAYDEKRPPRDWLVYDVQFYRSGV